MITLVPSTSTGAWLTDLVTVKDELGITDTATDTRLERLIAQASAMCSRYCGRIFARGRWAETLAAGGSPMVLSRLPVVAIVSVTRGGSVVDPSVYQLDQDAGLLYWAGAGRGGIAWCPPQIVVTYDAGYVVPPGTVDAPRTLPEDVERACLEVIKALWFSGGSAARDPALRSESVEGIGSTSWLDPQAASGGLPVLADTLLDPYRLARL